MAPASKPSKSAVSAAVRGVVALYEREVRAVVAHGSWVRGDDFWPGQSDLDLIVVTSPKTLKDVQRGIQKEFIGLEPVLGLPVEPWVMTEGDLEAWRRCRSIDSAFLTGNVQLDIAGFDVVDHHVVLWAATGVDPLTGFPVPRGDYLVIAAADRLRHLLERDFALWKTTEANRIACDALKAATLFFLLKRGLPPTRDKGKIFHLFATVVPNFPQRDETAKRIWELYQAGDGDGSPQHREACGEFVRHLVKLVAPPIPIGA